MGEMTLKSRRKTRNGLHFVATKKKDERMASRLFFPDKDSLLADSGRGDRPGR